MYMIVVGKLKQSVTIEMPESVKTSDCKSVLWIGVDTKDINLFTIGSVSILRLNEAVLYQCSK